MVIVMAMVVIIVITLRTISWDALSPSLPHISSMSWYHAPEEDLGNLRKKKKRRKTKTINLGKGSIKKGPFCSLFSTNGGGGAAEMQKNYKAFL